MGETLTDTAESENLSMRQNSNRENREIPLVSDSAESERFANVSDGKANMYADGKSDGSVVPATTTNNGATEAPAESDEGRDPAKRNAEQDTLHRTPGRIQGKSCGLAGVREAANFALDLRQEPYEVILHVRVCAGGGPKGPSLPRYCYFACSVFRGRPRGRMERSSPSRFANRSTHASLP